MSYKITNYTYDKATRAGLVVKPSKRKGKKLDVYKDGEYLHSVGQIGYKDYPTYLAEEGKKVAQERQRLYRLRHKQDTLGEKLALYLLW
jgi:hypothetical protein